MQWQTMTYSEGVDQCVQYQNGREGARAGCVQTYCIFPDLQFMVCSLETVEQSLEEKKFLKKVWRKAFSFVFQCTCITWDCLFFFHPSKPVECWGNCQNLCLCSSGVSDFFCSAGLLTNFRDVSFCLNYTHCTVHACVGGMSQAKQKGVGQGQLKVYKCKSVQWSVRPHPAIHTHTPLSFWAWPWFAVDLTGSSRGPYLQLQLFGQAAAGVIMLLPAEAVL